MGAVRGETHPDSVHPRNHSSARDEIQRNARHPRAKGPGGFRRRTILAWARATRGPYRTQTPAEASETLLEGGLSRDHHPLAPPNPPKDLPPNPSERLELELAFLTETAHRLARPQDGVDLLKAYFPDAAGAPPGVRDAAAGTVATGHGGPAGQI